MAVGVLQVPQLDYLKHKAKTASPAQLKREVAAEQVRLDLLQKLPAFGFDNLLANWILLDFIKYFGDDEVRAVTGYRLSPEYFEVIVDRDPRFLDIYYFLPTAVSIYAAMPEKSVALIAKGLKSLTPKVPPGSYYVWRQKGIDELLFLGDAGSARQSFEKAAEWASVYDDEESKRVAIISRQNAEFLARNPKSKNAQVSAWTMVLTNAVDLRSRQIAISRIQALGGKVIITPEGKLAVQPPKED